MSDGKYVIPVTDAALQSALALKANLISPSLVTPALGTPSSGTLTSCTGLPVSTGISGLGTGVATFLATPSSANLATAVTDETGSGGALVFASGPTLTGTTNVATLVASAAITSVSTTASGALCSGGHTPATYGAGFNLAVSGRGVISNHSSTTGLYVLNLTAENISAAIQTILKCSANASNYGEVYLENAGNGVTRFYARASGTGDAQSSWVAALTSTTFSMGIDQSDSSACVLSKSSTLGSSNVFRVDSTSLTFSLYDGLSFATVAKGITYKSGTGARAGNATLVAGTVTVTNTSVTANTIVIFNRKTIGGTVGNMSYTLSAGASFTLNSSSGTDTSVISYELVELV